MDYLRNRPFLVIQMSYKPHSSVHTEMKGWQKQSTTEGTWVSTETPAIVKRISNKILIEAQVIVDILNAKIIKNRYNDDDEKVLGHFFEKYKNEISRVILDYQAVGHPLALKLLETNQINLSEEPIGQIPFIETKNNE